MIGWIFCLIFLAACLLISREWFQAKEEINELASDRMRLQSLRDMFETNALYWREQYDIVVKERDAANENYRTLRASTAATIADLETNVNRLTGELFRANETITSRTNWAQRLNSELEVVTEERDSANENLPKLRQAIGTLEGQLRELQIESHRRYAARGEELDEAKVEIEALRHELATAREFGDQTIRLKEKIRDGLNSKRPNWKKLFEGESL